MKHHTLTLMAVLASTLSLSTTASAQNASAQLHQRALAATCANCHGTQGHAVSDSAVPGLAGMPATYMITQLKAFRDGSRPATVMHQLTKGYSDEQINSIAAYFAAQPR